MPGIFPKGEVEHSSVFEHYERRIHLSQSTDKSVKPPARDESLAGELHLPRFDRDVEVVFLRYDGTTEVMVVRTVWIVGIIEIECIFARMVHFNIYISSAGIRGIAAGLIGEGDKKLGRIVPEHLVDMELQILSVDLKLKFPILLRRPGLAARCFDPDPLRIGILQQLNMENQIEIWRIVIQLLEGRPLYTRQRGFRRCLEKVIFLLPETHEVVNIDYPLMGAECYMLEVA